MLISRLSKHTKDTFDQKKKISLLRILLLHVGKQTNGRSGLQQTTDRLIAAGVKQIYSLGVNIRCDNKQQITISEVLISRLSKHTKDTFDQKKKKKFVENFTATCR